MTQLTDALRYSDPALGYEAVLDERRRHVLHLLAEAEASMTVRDLAVEIARREAGDSAGIDDGELDRLRVVLHHYHVPKLAAAEFVEYDTAAKRVALRESAPLDVLDWLEA